MTDKTSATYVIGDVHGCFHTLKKLIAKIGWLIKRRENETFVTQKSR